LRKIILAGLLLLSACSYNFVKIDVPNSSGTYGRGINHLVRSDRRCVPLTTHTGAGEIHGFLRNTSGTITTMDVPPNWITVINGISTLGQTVRTKRGTGGGIDGRIQSFIRHSSGTTTPIYVEGSDYTEALLTTAVQL
jgi:hypothetical protein